MYWRDFEKRKLILNFKKRRLIRQNGGIKIIERINV